MSTELKLGLFFFIFLGSALFITFRATNFATQKGEYQVVFPRVARLKEADPVAYNGVRVGAVAAVAPVLVDGAPRVLVSFGVEARHKPSVLIGPNTVFRIGQGVLGGSSLEINSDGGEPITAQRLKGRIGEEPANLDEALAELKKLIAENRAGIKRAVDNVGDAAGEIREAVQENRPDLKRAVSNIAGLVEENRATVKAALAHFDEAASQIAGMVEENRANIRSTTARLPVAVQNVGDAAAEIRDAVRENRDALRRAMAGLAAFAPKLDRIGENLEVITRQIAQGKGTLGKLVFQDELHDKTVRTVDNFNQRLEEVKPLTSGLTDLKFVAGLDGGMDARSGSQTGYAYLRLEPRPWKFYEAGGSYRTAPTHLTVERDDPNKLNVDFHLMLGWRFLPDDAGQNYRLTMAGGLIETKIGGWVETPLWKDAALRVMVRQKDIGRLENDRRHERGGALVRATVSYRLWERVSVVAGVNDCIDAPGFWGGIRAELLDNDLRNLVTVAGFAP